jgi:ATP/maltotriose-dependent transcriptional regulator MalT/two-component SAPR family response regulator
MTAASPLIITQIVTPRKRPDLLHRRRLVDFLHEHIDRKLLLVSASAGYGKTSLLIDYAHDTDLPVCWLSLVEPARDPRVFLEYLIASMHHHFPEFGERSKALLRGSEVLTDPTPFVGTLVNEIYETIPDYFVVAIDDYHLVDGSHVVNLMVDTLVQHLPENCHIVISSRSIPTLTPRGLALLTARQEVAGLGVKELRFTAPEIQALLEQNFGQRLSDDAAEQLAERSEGWITGILLTTHTMWQGLMEGIIRVRGSGSKVYDYLVNEVFGQQPEGLQHFLLSTSILEEMSPLLCDQFLGASNSREVLRLLEEKNLFVNRLERGEERWYRYHPLFREFLLTKLLEEHPDRVRVLHANAARLLLQSGAPELAIQHYLEAEHHEDAVQCILDNAWESYDAGKLQTLAGWIDALPSPMVGSYPRLLWFRAKVHLETGELEQATDLFDRAHTLFSDAEEPLGQAQTLVEKSAVLRFQGELRKAIEACSQAIALVDNDDEREASRTVIASARRQIGTCHGALGNLTAGERELRRALAMYEQLGYEANIAHVHNDLGALLRLAGNLTGAEIHFREALEVWERVGNLAMASLAINNIAHGYYFRGQYGHALQLYEVGLQQARRAGLDRPMAFILAGIGDIHRARGDLDAALGAYEEGLEAVRQSRESFIICYMLDAIGDTHRLSGDYARALDYARQAFERAQERDSTFEMGLYQTTLGVIHYQQGSVRLAEDYLLRARDIFVHSDAKAELARASLYLAQTYYVAGRLQEGLVSMRLVLDCLLELGHDQFLLPTAGECRRVITHAVEKGMGDTLVGDLLRRLDAARETEPVSLVREEPVQVKPLLRVYGLGESRALRGDRPIASSEWGRAKSKELLFYLLSHRQRRKDQIGTDLWPELSPAKLRSSFHVALYRLRRALQDPDLLRYEAESYFFDRKANYWFDVEEFERAFQEASQAWNADRGQAAERYKDAVVLYGGDYLDDLSTDTDWHLVRREDLIRKYLSALQRLGQYHDSRKDYRQAMQYYRRILDKDSYQERAHREIMRFEALLGERTAALRRYHRLAEFLEDELGVAPAPETTALYEGILRGETEGGQRGLH